MKKYITACRIFVKACTDAYEQFQLMEKAFELVAKFPWTDPYTMFEDLTEYNGFLVEV